MTDDHLLNTLRMVQEKGFYSEEIELELLEVVKSKGLEPLALRSQEQIDADQRTWEAKQFVHDTFEGDL